MNPDDREIAAALRWAVGPAEVPPHVWAGIQESLRRRPRRRFRPWLIVAPAAAVAACALLAAPWPDAAHRGPVPAVSPAPWAAGGGELLAPTYPLSGSLFRPGGLAGAFL